MHKHKENIYPQSQPATFARKRKWAVSVSLTMICLAGLGLYSAINSSAFDPGQMTAGTIPYSLETRILAFVPQSSKPAISTLAEVPDGKTVYCSADALELAAMSRNAQETPQRQISQLPAELIWPVVKYGKDIYVRGWVRTPFSKEAAKLADKTIFNTPHAPPLGANPQQVTMKLDLHTSLMGLSYEKLPDGTSEFVWHCPRLTAHTYEKWQP